MLDQIVNNLPLILSLGSLAGTLGVGYRLRHLVFQPKLRVCLTHPDARLPLRAKEGDAGYDLYAIEDGVIPVGETKHIDAGLRIVLPKGYWALIRPRSSQGKIGLNSGTGVIDNGYVGPLGYYLTNNGTSDYVFKKGDRVGQLILIPMHTIGGLKSITQDQIPQTERGSGGFGSSGK